MTAGPACPAQDFWVGTYSTESGRGLLPLQSGPTSQDWRAGPPDVMMENASFAVFNPRADLHYVVDERDDGQIGIWWRSPMGGWRRLASVSSRGAAPCHLALSPAHDSLAVANYASGSVAVFPIDAQSGLIRDEPLVFQNSGKGANAERQEGPHAHCVRFAHGFLFSTDLGTDQVLAWPQPEFQNSMAEPVIAFDAPPGQGPRHIVFHATLPLAYLLTELGSQVFVLDLASSGQLRPRQQISTLPEGFDGASLGGHLELNASGTALYASNRGHDSLAVFTVNSDGGLTRRGIYPTGGQSPRHFLLAETQGVILIAHQNGNTVDVISLGADGTPGNPIAALPVRQPAFIGRVSTG